MFEARSLWPRRIATVAGGYAIIGGALAMIGWAADIPRLADWTDAGIAMFPNTALCAVLSGMVLLGANWGVGRGTRIVLNVAAWVVLLTGALTLFEHITNINLGIDTLFWNRPWGTRAATSPMRMGPPASLSFTLIGSALLFMGFGKRGRSISAAFGVTVAGIATLSIIGYLYGAHAMYGIPRFTGIALVTAVALFVIGVGIIASLPDRDPMRAILEPGAAGLLIRRAMPMGVCLALMLGWARVQIERVGLVDTVFGTAMRTLCECILLLGLLWWSVRMIRTHEKALQLSEAEGRRQARQLGAFLETAAICLHRVGPDGTILWANEAELRTLGYLREEYIGRNITEFHVDQDVIADILVRLHRDEKIIERVARMRCKNGAVKTVLIDSSVFWDEGRFVHTQCFTRDITELKRSESALREAKESAEAANIAKDNFVATLSHELRTPLTPVLATLSDWETSPEFPDALRSEMLMVRRNIDLEARLIDDLLDLTRIIKGKLSLYREVLDLHPLINSVVAMYRMELEAKNLRLRMKLEAPRHIVNADSGRLQQVFWNVLRNAVKFTEAGGLIEIDTRNDPEGRVQILVKDTGIGIAKESLAGVFRPFEQGSSEVAKRYGGLGLGLTIAQTLLAAQDGEIVAESAGVGHGSTFTITLPTVEKMVPAQVDVTVPRPVPVENRKSYRLLLVEDHADTARVLSRLLHDNGHQVKVAGSIRKAIEWVTTESFDLMVSDIGLPDGTGLELLRQIREVHRVVLPAIALSGYGMEEDIHRCREAGFDEHLTKPINLTKLEAAVRRLGAKSAAASAKAAVTA